jgi:SWI/SNF-related matrix-associated actin-dependent regulator of chromatin subfamily D
LEEPLHASLQKIMASPNYAPTLQTIASIDDALAHTVAAITDAKVKHAFFDALAADPVGFLNRWVSSQRRDLEVILGEREEGLRAGEEWRLSGDTGVWHSGLARESVGLWLSSRGK